MRLKCSVQAQVGIALGGWQVQDIQENPTLKCHCDNLVARSKTRLRYLYSNRYAKLFCKSITL